MEKEEERRGGRGEKRRGVKWRGKEKRLEGGKNGVEQKDIQALNSRN